MRFRALAIAVAVVGWTSSDWSLRAADEPRYLTPPQAIVDLLDAPPFPDAAVSPTRDTVALLHRRSMPPLSELAQPMLRLAGSRINARTNGPHRVPGIIRLSMMEVASGGEKSYALPAGTTAMPIGFSADGSLFAFAQVSADRITLWRLDARTAQARQVSDRPLNAAFGPPCEWLGEGLALVCSFVPSSRGTPPPVVDVPSGPNIQETSGKSAPIRTYQDLLTSAHDEALFDFYFTSQLGIVDAAKGAVSDLGQPGLVEELNPSPNGDYVLVSRLKRPFSWLVPAGAFPKDIEVWSRKGERVKMVADLPLADAVPMNGVRTGPRAVRWNASAPATLVWAEAQDDGDPKKSVPHRDRLMSLAAPFTNAPAELTKTEHRFQSISWGETGIAFVTEYDRPRRWTRTWALDPGSSSPRKLWDRSAEDAYSDPGTFVRRPGKDTLLQQGDTLFLSGVGSSPNGDHPFLDRLNAETLTAERLFQSDTDSYEAIVAVLDDEGRSVLTRYETATTAPNYFVRAINVPRQNGRNARTQTQNGARASQGAASTRRALTSYPNPAPQLQGIQKQRITYTRKDGVQLSAFVYLPPGYKTGEKLPMVLWAYPREFTDTNAAGQVRGSNHRFTIPSGASHLALLTQGYGIIDDPTMPIVGPGETANDTYIDQLVASAQAAVDKVVEMGVADRTRLGVGGHSYGAFMTANLLAHSDLFRAGIARSGAYNRTLTPFGFQNESRTFWEVPEIYGRMSPFYYANTINEPVLLIHGEADDNTGTFPIQSERFYMALKGHGATVRYVTLPYEAHGYQGRESVLHTVAEMLSWMDRYVKNTTTATQ
jgi:dipeptidyl aminopeptidase/acylaminoacyl peptidase